MPMQPYSLHLQGVTDWNLGNNSTYEAQKRMKSLTALRKASCNLK